jgi:hypothetical protein
MVVRSQAKLDVWATLDSKLMILIIGRHSGSTWINLTHSPITTPDLQSSVALPYCHNADDASSDAEDDGSNGLGDR